MAGLRGICSSPLSSADEADAPSSGFPDFSPSPESRSARRKTNVPLKRQETSAKRKKKASTMSSRPVKKQKPQGDAKSTKELVHEAPLEFVEFLADQLSGVQQAKYEKEFGTAQGFVIRLPPSSWKTKHKRSELSEWVQSLGFTSAATLRRYTLRVASRKAEIILHELCHRVPSIGEDDMENEVASQTEDIIERNDASGDAGEKERTPSEDYLNDPALVRLKEYFRKLESQELEVLSYSENHKLLSSTRHMAIADAMEDVLAQPSVRRDRRLARRLSKLGRISGRRISSIPLVPSTILPPVEDDWVWDQEMEKMSLTPVKRRISLGDSSVTQKLNILGEGVLQLVLHSGLVDVVTLKGVIRKVSTMWKNIAIVAYAWAVADYSKKSNLYSMSQVYTRHPRGHYLADGAYKEVFKVFSTEHTRLEAISVMDVGAIENTGNQGVVRQEVAHSVLLSDATENGICPNFLRIYDVFLAHEPPLPDRWGSKTCRKPSELLADSRLSVEPAVLIQRQKQLPTSNRNNEALYQYIRMEFCDGGDLEDFIGLQKNKSLPLKSVSIPFFFQMVFGLYCAREKFKLRHCDIKLLNFFLKDIGRSNLSKAEGADVVLHYILEDLRFVLRMPASFSYWVKLADYGAADSNPENLGKPVTIDQFATLENSPVEFLLEGDSAEQSYAADTFSLGLCLLHLFTGSAPYEEILDTVLCPADLLTDLKFVWMSPRKNSGFSVIRSVARGDDENTLYHTLYRYIVLFGLPARNPSEDRGFDKIWQVLLKHLRPEDPTVSNLQRRSRRTAGNVSQCHSTSVKTQYSLDSSLYSLANGSNEYIRRCREGLNAIPGATNLLRELVDFDPSQRPTLKQVLHHPMFASLRAPCENDATADYVISHYKGTNRGAISMPDV